MFASAQSRYHAPVPPATSPEEVYPGHGGLSTQQENELAARIAEGDREARDRMVQANLGLVFRIARDYLGRGLELDDLVAEGNIGLIHGAEEFDPSHGTRFSTYAAYWIKHTIRHALINTASTIRLPAHTVALLTKWRRAERSLSREAGRAPSFDEIASSLGLTEAQKNLVARANQTRQVKHEGGQIGDDEHWSPGDSIDRHATDDSPLEADDEREILLRRLDRLDARERAILSLRYGLEGEMPRTLKEIGRQLGMTREWVRKLEVRRPPQAPPEAGFQGGRRTAPELNGPSPGCADPPGTGGPPAFDITPSITWGPRSNRPYPPPRR